MKWLISNKSFTRWLRILHRDLGFLMVGLCIVYGISGILLNHLDGTNPAYKTEAASFTLKPGMDRNELTSYWNDVSSDLPALKRILPGNDNSLRIFLEGGGTGVYNITSGDIQYSITGRRHFIYWINKFHYNQVEYWTIVADIFAVLLIFFALSGILMVKGKKGIGGSGKWYLLAGILIPVIYVLLS